MERVKIVLDADVLIHFSKADKLSLLPQILPEFEHVILSAVYQETKSIRQQIDNQIKFMGNLTKIDFAPTGDMRREYAELRKKYGAGESACMAYCLFTHDVIGSSNLKDIKEYCTRKSITYLTTIGFLYYAFVRNLLTPLQCTDFINTVNDKGSRLPITDIVSYSPNVKL